MKTVNIILMGYGRVGQAFLRMAGEKRALLEDRHDLHLQFSTILELRGALHFPRPLSPDSILKDLSLVQSFRMSQYWRPGFDLVSALDKSAPGVLVDCTPSKAGNAMPESGYLHQAFERKWHVVTANKGPLVADLRGLVSKAKQNTVALKISGATAAALPTVDVGFYSLAGTRVYRIEGILNGTTNYILTRMSGGADYRDALKEAQEKGITEPDPSLDLEGWDTAFKLLLITNTVCDTDFTLDDVKVEGIMNMPGHLIREGREPHQALKLLGIFSREQEQPYLQVKPSILDSAHPLFGVNDTNKGITFFTDTMSTVTVTGGKSDPRGAAAALLKDIINIYR